MIQSNEVNAPITKQPINASNKASTHNSNNNPELSHRGFNIRNMSNDNNNTKNISNISIHSINTQRNSASNQNSIMSIVNSLTKIDNIHHNTNNMHHNQPSLTFMSNESNSITSNRKSVKDLHFTYSDEADDKICDDETKSNTKKGNFFFEKQISKDTQTNYAINSISKNETTARLLLPSERYSLNSLQDNKLGVGNANNKKYMLKTPQKEAETCTFFKTQAKEEAKELQDISFNDQPDLIQHSKTNPLKKAKVKHEARHSICNKYPYISKWTLSNRVGDLLKEKFTINSKTSMHSGDHLVNFCIETQKGKEGNNNDATTDEVILNKPLSTNSSQDYSSFTNKPLFSIYYYSNIKKCFFMPYKEILKYNPIQIAYNTSAPYRFCTKQKIEVSSTFIEITPDLQKKIASIKIKNQEPVIAPGNKEVNFIINKGVVVLQTTPVQDNQTSVCSLSYEENKGLWIIIPQCLDFWVITTSKISLEQSVLIKIGKEFVILASPIISG